MKEVVELLKNKNKTIATMESCTGGFIASSITYNEGASEVLKFSAVTYSNEFKIKLGVNEKPINDYSVYSIQVAREMAKNISEFAQSDYGIGITGKINRIDKNNLFGSNDKIFYSIYNKENNKYYDYETLAIADTRKNNKEYILKNIEEKLINILGERLKKNN